MSKVFNIKPSDTEHVKYVVNKDERVVVCIIEKTSDLFINFAHDNFVLSPYFYNAWGDKDFLAKLEMPNRFIGIARCSQDDEWNEATGRLIAFSRAKDNVNKSFFKRANTYVHTIDRWVDNSVNILRSLGDKLTINTEHRHNLIDSILGEEPTNGVQGD